MLVVLLLRLTKSPTFVSMVPKLCAKIVKNVLTSAEGANATPQPPGYTPSLRSIPVTRNFGYTAEDNLIIRRIAIGFLADR